MPKRARAQRGGPPTAHPEDAPGDSVPGSSHQVSVAGDTGLDDEALSAAYFKELFQSSPDGIVILNNDGEVVDANAAFQALFGYELSELCGQRLDDTIVPPGSGDAGRWLSDDVLREGFVHTECVRQCRDGSLREVSILGRPIHLGGRQRGLFGIYRDISQSKRAERALRESERQLRTVVNNAPVVLYAFDRNGHFTLSDGRALAHLGLRPGELVERSVWEVYRDNPQIRGLVGRALAGQENSISVTVAGRAFEAYCAPAYDEHGALVGATGMAIDVTDRALAEEEANLAANALANTGEGVMIMDTDERIVFVNRAFCNITGYTSADALGRTPAELHAADSDSAEHERMWRVLAATDYWQGEVWRRRKNGDGYPELLSMSAVRDHTDEITHYVGVFNDISAYKAFEERLDFLTRRDPLTGLLNRSLLREELTGAVNRTARAGGDLGLLYVDIDHFKRVNDSLGHSVGDSVIKEAAARLTATLDQSSVIARIGGDELAVVLEGAGEPYQVGLIAERVLEQLRSPYRYQGEDLPLNASIGIACFPYDGSDAETLMKNADAALYRAKQGGRDTWRFHSPELSERAYYTLKVGGQIRNALKQEELRLHYQPVVELESGHIRGLEVLVRWPQSQQATIPASELISVAEDTGLIDELSEWVLASAAAQARAWLDAGLEPLYIAVNLSARQFSQLNFADRVGALLAANGLDPSMLVIEVTETMAMTSPERNRSVFKRLRELGVRIAIDDFGTGYSSLNYLKQFPVDYLKIDRSFVGGTDRDAGDIAITEAIVSIAKSLGLGLVAEGIETRAQRDFLAAAGCECGQGFYFAYPAEPESVVELLRADASSREPSRG